MNSILLCIFRCLRDNWSYIGGYLRKKTSQHAISWFFPLAQLGLVSPKFLVGFSIKARAENREWSEQIFGGSFRNERPLFFQLPGLAPLPSLLFHRAESNLLYLCLLRCKHSLKYSIIWSIYTWQKNLAVFFLKLTKRGSLARGRKAEYGPAGSVRNRPVQCPVWSNFRFFKFF